MFYWNRRKEMGLPLALTKRLLTVIGDDLKIRVETFVYHLIFN
jgi:hypothetical protein